MGTLRNYLILFITLLAGVAMNAQTKEECEALIQKGIDAMWQKQHARSLELLTEARNMASKNHWYKQEFLALNNIGANYYTMLDYGEALNYYLESYTLAVKKLEPVNEMVILNNIAILYSTEENYAKAKEYLNKAYNIAIENKDTLKIGLYAMNLSHLADVVKDYNEARTYVNIALPYLKKDKQLYHLGLASLAETNLNFGKTTLARTQAEELLKKVENFNFNEVGMTLMKVIARSYIKENRPAEALTALQKAIDTEPGLKVRQELLGLMADVYKNTGQYEKALSYKDSVLETEKKLNTVKNGELYQTSRVKFELQDYQNRLAINEEKLKSEQKLLYYLIAVAVAIVIIIILIARYINAKRLQKQFIAERHEKELALQLEKEKNDNLQLAQQISEKETAALLEQERLKSEIEVRNRKLSARALYLSERNTLIEELINSVGKNPALSGNPALTQHIQSLKGHLKGNDEWESFVSHFEEVNNRLLEKLKTRHPALTANDLRFIAYIYMNLSTKEIATLLNITPEACRKRRERLAAKMELPASTTLYDYLSFV